MGLNYPFTTYVHCLKDKLSERNPNNVPHRSQGDTMSLVALEELELWLLRE